MSNLPIDPNALSTALVNAIQASESDDGTYQYLKMTKAGDWIFGQDETDVQDGSLWAIDPRSIQKGFIAWEEGSKEGEAMAPIFGAPPIIKADLDDVSAKWTEQLGFNLVCTNGEDKGAQCQFKTNSRGGRKAIKSYMSALNTQLQSDPDNCVALVSLESEHYKHKEFGRIYNPIITIGQWVSLDTTAPEEPAPKAKEPDEEPAPTQKRKRRAVSG